MSRAQQNLEPAVFEPKYSRYTYTYLVAWFRYTLSVTILSTWSDGGPGTEHKVEKPRIHSWDVHFLHRFWIKKKSKRKIKRTYSFEYPFLGTLPFLDGQIAHWPCWYNGSPVSVLLCAIFSESRRLLTQNR